MNNYLNKLFTPKLTRKNKYIGSKKTKKIYVPSVNQFLSTPKTLSPSHVYSDECFKKGKLKIARSGSYICENPFSIKAAELLLDNLRSKKPIDCSKIVAPKQYLSNCWFNCFFMSFFISDLGRTFSKSIRETMITGFVYPKKLREKLSENKNINSNSRIPVQFWKELIKLNLMIDGSINGDLTVLADTNNIIRGLNKYQKDFPKTQKAWNPVNFYLSLVKEITRFMPVKKYQLTLSEYYANPNISIDSLVHNATSDIIIIHCDNNVYKPLYLLDGVYRLDSVVLRDTKGYHFSAYITCNNEEYMFDGASYNSLEKRNWKENLNKDKSWKFDYRDPDSRDLSFNFTKDYCVLIFYKH